MSFSELTTIRAGGPIGHYVPVDCTNDLIDAVRHFDATRTALRVIGQGSNLVAGDDHFPGAIVHARSSRITIRDNRIDADAGVPWDLVVAASLDAGLSGLEPLSGIPGTVGATPIQNVGAYGAVVAHFLTHVVVFDRHCSTTTTLTAAECGFGRHRRSVFKDNDRYVILSVQFQLHRGRVSQPIRYAALAQHLQVAPGDTAPAISVRDAVLALRHDRGMIVDPTDHDTWSVGSFFVNPVVPQAPTRVRTTECPRYPDADGIKISAAWLIEHAGFARGYGAQWRSGRVRLSTRHTLAITNRGGATASEILAFAAHIRQGVEQSFGVRLHPECDLLNCSLP